MTLALTAENAHRMHLSTFSSPVCTIIADRSGLAQLSEAEGLVTNTRAKAVVLLNAQWTDTKSVPSRHGSFVGSFETVYCFQPIAIQVCVCKLWS